MADDLSALSPAMQAVITRFLASKPRCLLCGQHAGLAHVFLPDDPQAWGMQAGVRGGAIFGLCQRCAAREDMGDRVVAALWIDKHQREAAIWN